VTALWRSFPLGLRYMAAGAFFFSLMSLFVKLAGERLPSQQIVLARAVVSLVLSYLWLRRGGISVWGVNRRLLVLRGLLGFGGLYCFYYALTRLPLADATVIQYTNPIFAGLLAAWLLREMLGRREIVCVAVGLAGVLLIARPTFIFGAEGTVLPPFAVGVALLGAIFSAAAYVTVRKLGETDHALVIVFYFPLVAVPLAIPTVIPVALWPTPWEWFLLLAVGVTTQIAQVYMTNGLKLERAGRATAVGYLQIVFAAMWGMLFFVEIPDLWLLAGTVLIVGSTVWMGRGARGDE
jgi:drug/metabolite transporter (DMT)-like permease